MKNKLIIVGIVLIVAIIPVITLANMKFRQLDSKGRTIIYSSDDMENLEEGTKVSLAIPLDGKNNDMKKSNEELMKQKNEDIKKARAEGKPTSMSEEEKQALISDLDDFANSENNSEMKNKEEKFKNILKKYYNTEDIDNLLDKINKEIHESTGSYKIPEASKEMLKLTIDLLKSNKITTEEEEIVRYVLEELDAEFIEDENLVNELDSLNVTID